jgi:YHS domain-containing protein
MKSRIYLAALVVVALVAGNSLRAADEAALKCPVSGQPTKADKTVDFNGGKVQFCCENCPKAFEKDPAKYAAKANLQLFQTGQLKQTACPLTGRPCAADKMVKVGGKEVGVCCGNCLAKATKLSADEQVDLLFKDTTKGFKAASK